jgi:hypothetical protein
MTLLAEKPATSAATWSEFFQHWPVDLPRRGVLVTTFGEQIDFDGFLTSEGFVLVERRTPDTIGARKVMVPYACIAGLKFTDVLKSKPFTAAGFTGTIAKG